MRKILFLSVLWNCVISIMNGSRKVFVPWRWLIRSRILESSSASKGDKDMSEVMISEMSCSKTTQG